MIDIKTLKDPEIQLTVTLDKWKWVYILALMDAVIFTAEVNKLQCQAISSELTTKYSMALLEKRLTPPKG